MAKIQGWYYDQQLRSPLTSVTLHANKWWQESTSEDGKTSGQFINWKQIGDNDNGFGKRGGKCDDDVFTRAPLKNQDGTSTNLDGCGYGLDPICTSLLQEDFSVSISNTWSEFGGDPIGETWNSLRGPLSGIAKPLINSINELFSNNDEAMADENSNRGRFSKLLERAVDWAHRKYDRIVDNNDIDIVSFLNKAIVTQGTRFSYYGGTGISFGGLGMKFTIFPKYDGETFIEVPEQVEKLYPYFIGQMESFEDATGINGDEDDGSFQGQVANKCFMFQKPPGGYLTEMFDIDITQEGTLKLKIGGYYEINNLVCSDIMLNFSKNMVKNPTNNTISPLFCDVAINLRASTKYTDRKLKDFISGNGKMKDFTKEINKSIEENLDAERKELDNLLKIDKPTYIIDH